VSLPEGAALGSTDDPAKLILGDPGSVRTNASTLADEATKVERLADDVDDITIAGWSGGWGEPAYAAARSAEQDKWRAYAEVLRTTSKTLTTYAGSLTTAQSRAADAIRKWEEGEQATRTAVSEYNAAVDAYNAYVNRQVCVPTYGGGPVTPSIGPSRPGPFVDPGEALREEAEQILEDARTALDEAGETAVRELGGLPGAKTEGSSGPGMSGSMEGPSIDWGDWKDTFGRNPSSGKDGKYEHGVDGDSPFAINFGKIEGELHAWGAEGSVEDYWGDVKVHADGSITVGGLDGSASGKIDANGLTAQAGAGVTLLGLEGKAGGEWGYLSGEVSGSAAAEARAEGDVTVGTRGVHAGGELFAGGRAEVGVSGDVGGVGGDVSAEGWAGIGISGDVDFGFHDGKFEIGGSGGAAFGLGGKIGGHITIDPGEVLETGGDIVDAIGGLLR
jgi:hypothetical protein